MLFSSAFRPLRCPLSRLLVGQANPSSAVTMINAQWIPISPHAPLSSQNAQKRSNQFAPDHFLCRTNEDGPDVGKCGSIRSRVKQWMKAHTVSHEESGISHKETIFVPFQKDQIGRVVADVHRYSEFVPWVQGVKLFNEDPHNHPNPPPLETHILKSISGESEPLQYWATMNVGFKHLSTSYTSCVTVSPWKSVKAVSDSSILELLMSTWNFTDDPSRPWGTVVDFSVTFRFRSGIMQKIAINNFTQAHVLMVSAFVERCKVIYPDYYKQFCTQAASLSQPQPAE